MKSNDHPSPARFIVIEGIDGAGTTTQSRMLVDWLVAHGRPGALTCEPSKGPVGLLLRSILSGRTVAREDDGSVRPMSNEVIALLFAADRIDHLEGEILPFLGKGTNVVSDRYYHSSLTYQALEEDLHWIRSLNARAIPPDVTYILDLPAEQAASRRKLVRGSEELYEGQSTQEKLQEAYRRLPRLLTEEEVVLIDGRPDAQSVHRTITADLANRFQWS